MKTAQAYVTGYLIQKLSVNRRHIPKDIINICVQYLIDRHISSYKNALYNSLFNNRCIGVYDFQAKQWRAAYYINHWDSLQRIAVRCVESCYAHPELTSNFCIIDKFPVNFVSLDGSKLKGINLDFEGISNVTPRVITKWNNGQIIERE